MTLVVFTLLPLLQLQPERSGSTLHSSPARQGSIWHHHFCSTMEASTQEGAARVVPATCPGKQEHFTVWERSSILFLLQHLCAAMTSQVPGSTCAEWLLWWVEASVSLPHSVVRQRVSTKTRLLKLCTSLSLILLPGLPANSRASAHHRCWELHRQQTSEHLPVPSVRAGAAAAHGRRPCAPQGQRLLRGPVAGWHRRAVAPAALGSVRSAL